jgi:hypothetical protein
VRFLHLQFGNASNTGLTSNLYVPKFYVKYFPHGDVLKAGPKAGSSFMWQSIIARMTIFKRVYI